MQTYTPSRLGRHRATWFSQICTGLLGDTAEHPAMLPGGFRTDLGDVNLLRGALVARIGRLLLRGELPSSIAEWVRSSEVFLAPPPDVETTEALVQRVQERMADRGLWTGPTPWKTGVRLWDPEGLCELLLEYWASQRSAVVPPERLRRELTGCWGVEDSRTLDEWTVLLENPFSYNVGREGLGSNDGSVLSLVRQCLEHPYVTETIENWAARFAWDRSEVGHLFRIGAAIHASWPAKETLESMENTGIPERPEKVHFAAVDTLLQHGNDHYRSLGRLTNYERSLMEKPDEDGLFINGCIDVYTTHLSRNNRLRLEETGPGTWGPFPWWSVVVEGPLQVEAARRVLEWRSHPLTCRTPETDSAPLALRLDAPALGSVKVNSEFWFYPRLARELCQLLIIARRGSIAVEFCERSMDDEWEGELTSLGVYLLDVSPEQAHIIETWAAERLRELLPTNPPTHRAEFEPGEHLALALSELLSTSAEIDPWGL